MREDALRHFNAGRHQEGRPIDRVEAHDVLADHVQRGRPVALEFFAVGVGEADAGDVIGQRVHPHIHDVLVVAGHADAPVEGGARDRQVLQAAAHEAGHFVEPLLWQHVIRPREKFQQLVLIGRELEEIALLLHPVDRRAGFGRHPHLLLVEMGLVRGVIGLVAHRIPAGIFAEIDVAVLLHAPPDFLRRAVMALLGGADEVVVRAAHALDHGLEKGNVALKQLVRRQPLFGAGLLDFHPVLVGAGEEIDVVAVEPHEARDGVGRDRLIGVADMRRPVRVGDRGGDVEGCFGRHFRLC